MAFSSFKSLAAVLTAYGVVYDDHPVVEPRSLPVSDYFRAELTLMLTEGAANTSEAAICENLIAPILKEVWKFYRQDFLLWSHPTLVYDDHLSGVPDYVLAQRSPLGRVVFDRPFCTILEAKQDNFQEGWGQCLAAMIAAQLLNQDQLAVVFGIVSNGDRWEFGQLRDRSFSKHPRSYGLEDLDLLVAAINDVFFQCAQQLAALGIAAVSS